MASDVVSVLPHQRKGVQALAFQGVGEAYATGPSHTWGQNAPGRGRMGEVIR